MSSVWNDSDSMKMSGLEQGFDCFPLGFCVWCSRPLAYSNTSTSQLTDRWALPLGIWNQYCLWWCLGICISATGKASVSGRKERLPLTGDYSLTQAC